MIKIAPVPAMLVILMSATAFAEDSNKWSHPSAGVSFIVPAGLKHSVKSSRKKPFSAVFELGKPPMATSVHFKEVVATSTTLEHFLKQEHASWKEGGYEKEMTQTDLKIDGQPAVRLVRKSRFGEIHYIVFQAPKNKHIYGLWHMTSKMGDPERSCLAALEAIVKSMKLSKS